MSDLPDLNASTSTGAIATAQEGAGNPFTFALPGDAGDFTIDLAAIPADTRMELLRNAVKTAVVNRVNVANVRHGKKLEPFAAFDAYGKAMSAYNADPLSNPKPEGDAPTAPTGEHPGTLDLRKLAQEGADALLRGELRRPKSDTPAKSRAPKDPVDALVTQQVVRELFKKNKELDAKYTFPQATKEVGASGIEYLKGRIADAVAKGGNQADLEKMLETRYLAPARVMAGVKPLGGKSAELPNIL